MLETSKTLFGSRPMVAWPPTTLAWPFRDFFQNVPKLLETSKKRCLTVGRRSRDLRPLSRDRSATFFRKFSNCLKRPKNVVWESADGRVTSDHCRVTVQRFLKKKFLIAWNVQKTLFDSRPMVAWPPTTVAWPFSDFFQIFFLLLETSKKRCLTVSRRSRDLRPLSRDRSATFFKFFSNCLKRPKNVVWQSTDGRVTSTTVAWPFSDFFQNFPKSLETSKNVVWLSADGRVTSDHCRVTVQRLFSTKFLIAWNVEKSLFDSRPTVAWPPTTVAWPFSDFFKKIPNGLKRRENVDWQSADGRLTSDNSCVTFQRLFFHISP